MTEDEANSFRKVLESKNQLEFLQLSISQVKTKDEGQKMLEKIAAVISEETLLKKEDFETKDCLVNQVVLNLAFRNYYSLAERFHLEDKHFGELTQQLHNESDFLMLYAVLLTSYCHQLDAEMIRNKCLKAIDEAIKENSTSLLAIVKALNLLCRKFSKLDVDVHLEHIYYMLQSQIVGMREETITLFRQCMKDSQRAAKSFQLINDYWPWTNRNKYFLLSCILSTHTLQHLLEVKALRSVQDFFNGLRLSLSYKRLFAASQYLVKALSCQKSEELLQLSVKILTHGSRKEMINYHAQWFGRITQKDALFALLHQQLEIVDALEHSNMLDDDTKRYRLILIFSMFSRQVLQLSKLHFFKISTELITNCFYLDTDSQLLIFKFVVENLTNFAIEDCLEFLLSFIRTHKCVDTAQYRNNILGKLPTIINYISKTFSRLGSEDSSTLKGSIRNFFMGLQQIIEEDVHSTEYQPKIFALKLQEILLQSLYLQTPIKNAKNCSVAQNQHLGRFLVEQEKIFNASEMQLKLLALLHDPLGFDDALELLVTLLKQLNFQETQLGSKKCLECVQNCNLDDCALSTLFAEVAVNSFCAAKNEAETQQLFSCCLNSLHNLLPSFVADPLLVCKTKHHLFGFLEAINVCVAAKVVLFEAELKTVLKLLDNILNTILTMLNVVTLKSVCSGDTNSSSAASFQDIDESLEILVRNSAFETLNKHQDCRKFLLMSFWLTLKACCDLATTIGCYLVHTSETNAEHLELLEQCLQINVCVLTKCRHKGAIEAAGLTIGKLTKCLTKYLPTAAKAYQLLHNCLDLLFFEHGDQQISTTRRGAGLSIMFLHIIKNEEKRTRPLLQLAIRKILVRLKQPVIVNAAENYDCLEALTLHYLCVLVKDTELREPMSKYHDDIMMAAIEHIDNPEWTICNAALQLFGAIVPKIVGQKQATEFEDPVSWEPTEVTFMEITLRLPKTCAYILNYCEDASKKQTSGAYIRSIMLFLEFLSKVEHLKKSEDQYMHSSLLDQFRELLWTLLGHKAEKVRKLAATCFVRAHEFHCDLPLVLLELSKLLFFAQDENDFQGLTYVLIEGTHKIQHESVHSLDPLVINKLVGALKVNLSQNFEIKQRNLYSLCKLLDLLLLLGLERDSVLVKQLINIDNNGRNCIGIDIWQEKLAQII